MSALERLGIDASKLPTDSDHSPNQSQTRDCFGFKWHKRETFESTTFQNKSRAWFLERFCDGDPSMVSGWLSNGRKLILDAGCGAGNSALLLFGDHLRHHDYLGIDISDAVEVARDRFHKRGFDADFLQMDLCAAPIPDGSIDIILSEGVLHHTDNTEKSFKHLAKKLKSGGIFLFYIYAKKAAVREYTDDFVRNQLMNMSDAEAWRALIPLTRLGMALGGLNTSIDIPEDIPLLGIRSGTMDIQRFFYWYVCKAYYDSDYTLEEMNHINFDWFRPLNCHRHTPEEIIKWCKDANINIERLNVQQAGITVIARRAG